MNDLLAYAGPSPTLTPWVFGLALCIAGVAAVTDWRTGQIPNWLTLPPMVVGPLLYGLVDGPVGAAAAVVAMLVCGAVPILIFFRQGMAGGDVKLFIAVAALVGLSVGLESQLLGLMVGAIYAMGRLVWDGKLFATLARAFFVGLNPILPRAWRREPSPELMEYLRLGAAIFAGVALAVGGRLVAVLGIPS